MTDEAATNSDAACALAAGGLAGDMEVLTRDGLSQVAELSPGTEIYTLSPLTGRAKLTPVQAIQSVAVDELVAIETRRADLRIGVEQQLPFTTRDVDEPRFIRAGNVAERAAYTFLAEWQTVPRTGPQSVDITEYLTDYELCATYDCHGHTFRAALPDGCEPQRRNGHVGYCFDPETFATYQTAIEAIAEEVTIHAGPNHHRRPYRFSIDDFLRLLGWYITEGSVHWSKSSHTAQVKIAQETSTHRRSIAALFDRLGITVSTNERRFMFGSVVFGRLLERLCGSDSRSKRLPALIWECSQAQQRLLLNVLLKGDGDDNGTYYTSSRQLAHDVLRLCVELGIKPRYARCEGRWRVYIRDVNDGFRPAMHVRRVPADEDVYRLTLRDHRCVMAGRNGTFQWVGVSRIV